ncbi:hypothetical protein [Sinomonas gamaensis]|uniref:hypothetical protein n=1 Tax=Sinomonas gamaensis TaxID=2565624 RepID=UPI0011081853|nr:hypothetical protein [Sinomonas gamaensis]
MSAEPMARHESARRASMAAHPSNHTPKAPGTDHSGEPREDELIPRWERLRLVLVQQGLTDEEARTEVVRIGALEVWDGFASDLREHRRAGRQNEANAAAVGLRSMQGATLPILRHPGDVVVARSALNRARHRLRHNGVVLGRLQDRPDPLRRAERAFGILEAFLGLA